METENKQPKFPYASYPTFRAFIFYLHDTVLSGQIDNTMMPSNFSGSARASVTATLKSLGLIDAQNNTTDKLKELVEAFNTPKWQEAVKKCVLSAYDTITQNIDLKTATRKQLDGMFEDESPQMRDKYIRFFLSVNKEAGIDYSPHLRIRKKTLRKRTDKTTIKCKAASKKGNEPPEGIAHKKQPPSNMFDQPIPIVSDNSCFIRVPRNITVNQVGLVKAAVAFIEAMAKQNEETE